MGTRKILGLAGTIRVLDETVSYWPLSIPAFATAVAEPETEPVIEEDFPTCPRTLAVPCAVPEPGRTAATLPETEDDPAADPEMESGAPSNPKKPEADAAPFAAPETGRKALALPDTDETPDAEPLIA